MSLPNIPNITPLISLDECDTINLLLSSIALEEIGLSHILNAEGEKLQYFLKTNPCHLDDLLLMNNSVNKTLKAIVKSQMMLLLKLEDVVGLAEQSSCYKQTLPCQRKKRCNCKCKDSCKPKHCEFCHKSHCNDCCYVCESHNIDKDN